MLVTTTLQLTDQQLTLMLQQEPIKATSYLYDQYSASIYGLLIRELKNEKLASEILKQTFINVSIQKHQTELKKQSTFVWLLQLMVKTAFYNFKIHLNCKSSFSSFLPHSAIYKNTTDNTKTTKNFLSSSIVFF